MRKKYHIQSENTAGKINKEKNEQRTIYFSDTLQISRDKDVYRQK